MIFLIGFGAGIFSWVLLFIMDKGLLIYRRQLGSRWGQEEKGKTH